MKKQANKCNRDITYACHSVLHVFINQFSKIQWLHDFWIATWSMPAWLHEPYAHTTKVFYMTLDFMGSLNTRSWTVSMIHKRTAHLALTMQKSWPKLQVQSTTSWCNWRACAALAANRMTHIVCYILLNMLFHTAIPTLLIFSIIFILDAILFFYSYIVFFYSYMVLYHQLWLSNFIPLCRFIIYYTSSRTVIKCNGQLL